MGLTIPDDLADKDLSTFAVRDIVAARKMRKAAQRKRDALIEKIAEIDAYIDGNIQREAQLIATAEPQGGGSD